MGDTEDLTFILRMRDEATRTLQKVEKELRETGAVSTKTGRELRQTARGFDELGDEARQAEDSLKSMGRQFGQLVTGGAILYTTFRQVSGALREFGELQQGMSEVRKTSGLGVEELDQLQAKFIQVSEELGTSTDLLTDFAAEAARAGVSGKDDLEKFAETAAKIKIALGDINTEQLMRLANMSTSGVGNVDKLAAALNFLDDTANTSSQAILEVAKDVSIATAQFPTSGEMILAWSTVLAEAGVDASVAGTTILKLGSTITQVTARGGKELQNLAGIAGMTSEQFKELAANDTAEAINQVVRGLAALGKTNPLGYENALKMFELDGIMMRKGINGLTRDVQKFDERIKQAFDNTEAMRRFNTEIELQQQNFQNSTARMAAAWENFQATLGEDFADAVQPVQDAVAELLTSFREWFEMLPESQQNLVAFGAVGTAALAGLGVTLAGMGLNIAGTAAAMKFLGVSLGGVASSAATAAKRFLPWVAVLTTISSVAAAAHAAYLDLIDGEEALTVETEGLSKATQDLQALLSDQSATNKAINAAARLAQQRLLQAQAARAAAVEELELRKAIAERSATQIRIRSGTASVGAAAGDAAAGARAGGDQASVRRQKEEVQRAENEIIAAEEALNAARLRVKFPIKLDGSAAASAAVAPEGKDKKDKKGGQSDAEREAERRSEALRDLRIETNLYQAQLEALGNVEAEGDSTAVEVWEEKKAVMEATADLRRRSGQEDAQLTKDEVDAVLGRVRAERELKHALDANKRHEEHLLEMDDLEGLLAIATLRVDKQREELEVHKAIQRAKQEGRGATKQEIEDARERARAQTRLDQRNEGTLSQFDAELDIEYANRRIQIGFVENQQTAERIAVLEKEMSLKERGLVMTPAIEQATRQAAAAQWELTEAQREWNERQAEAMGYFDAGAGFLYDLITGAKSAKDAINDLIKSLIDLIWQYQILGPIRRQFEQGGGGFSGLFSAIGAGIFHNGGVAGSPQQSRLVDPRMFVGAPRYHNGLAPNETAAILEKTEAVAPLFRGRDGKVGIRSEGGGGSKVLSIGDINVTVNGVPSDDPINMGKVIGETIKTKVTEVIMEESRPGGMLWGSR